MDMPFYFFFGLLGLAAGALVVWLLLADHPFEASEPPIGPVDKVEATMLAAAMTERGRSVDEETVVVLIELHNAYVEGRIREELALAAESEAASPTATVPDVPEPEVAASEPGSQDPTPESPERV
jgi:hypothetical protein